MISYIIQSTYARSLIPVMHNIATDVALAVAVAMAMSLEAIRIQPNMQ